MLDGCGLVEPKRGITMTEQQILARGYTASNGGVEGMSITRCGDLTPERREALICYINLVAQDVQFRQRGLFARLDGRHDYREYWRRCKVALPPRINTEATEMAQEPSKAVGVGQSASDARNDTPRASAYTVGGITSIYDVGLYTVCGKCGSGRFCSEKQEVQK